MQALRERGQAALLVRGVILAAASMALPAAAQTAPVAASDDAIAEIVVTAQKRDSVLQKTPDTITAITGAALTARGQNTLTDIANLVPNTSFSANFGISQIFIRGIGNNFYSPGGDPGVAFYNDGIYVSDQEGTNVALYDLDRIEILRGPQGALYGRNATGGAINVISAAPTDILKGGVSATFGDYGRAESEGFLSGKVGGSITARLSYQVKSLSGFTRNELAGQPGALDRFDDLKSQAIRLQVATPLFGDDELRLIGSYYHQDDNGPASKVLADPFPQPAELLFGARPSLDPRSLKSTFGGNKREVYGVAGQYHRSFGDKEFTLLGGWRRSKHDISYDQDGTVALQSTTQLVTGSDDYSVEARLASPTDGPFDWLIGATYLDFTQDRITSVFTAIPLGFVVPGAPLNIPFNVNFSSGGTVHSQSIAGYVDTHYRFTDRLRLSAGFRYTNDKKSADEFVNFLGVQKASPSDRWSNLSGKIGLDYQASDDVLAYASVAKGFKSGAINLGALTPPVSPETVWNGEIGLKTSFLDRRAQLNVAAFYSDYRDLQVLQIGALSQILSNAAKAHIGGIEVEGILKPVRGLTINANASFLDATYKDFVTPDARRQLASVDVSGNQLALTSKFQANLGVEYRATLAGGAEITPRVDFAYRSKYYFTEFNTADAMQDSYGKLDAAITYTPAKGGWRLFAWVHNITDVNVTGSMAIVSPLLGSVRVVNLIPPRNFGVGAGMSF
jgi:iron complex outermembrane recepter protein